MWRRGRKSGGECCCCGSGHRRRIPELRGGEGLLAHLFTPRCSVFMRVPLGLATSEGQCAAEHTRSLRPHPGRRRIRGRDGIRMGMAFESDNGSPAARSPLVQGPSRSTSIAPQAAPAPGPRCAPRHRSVSSMTRRALTGHLTAGTRVLQETGRRFHGLLRGRGYGDAAARAQSRDDVGEVLVVGTDDGRASGSHRGNGVGSTHGQEAPSHDGDVRQGICPVPAHPWCRGGRGRGGRGWRSRGTDARGQPRGLREAGPGR